MSEPTTSLHATQPPLPTLGTNDMSSKTNPLVHSSRLKVEHNDAFLREEGTHRAWLLRGVNLSGSCKFPKYPVPQPSHVGGAQFLAPHPTKVALVVKKSQGRRDGSTDVEREKMNEQHDHSHSANGIASEEESTITPLTKNRLEYDGQSKDKTTTTTATSLNTPGISFVGRPFELGEADEHLARLRHWGFRMIRWVVTWEAIEHQGPGIHDHEFLEYTVKALLKAKEYGFKVMIDFHQDVWSRFSGGSGAPLWTFHLAGLDPHNFAATGAAAVHNTLGTDERLLRMVWLTNYYKLACATMFTLFYAGRTLAHDCTFDDDTTGEANLNIQDYLQNHFLASIAALVEKIHACRDTVTGKNLLEDSVVIGYDSWNEPSCGWIGLTRLDSLPDQHDMRQGDMPTPLQCFMLGEGMVVKDVDVYRLELVGPVKKGTKVIDPAAYNSFNAGSSPESTEEQHRPVKAWLTEELRDAYDAKYRIKRNKGFPRAGECLWAQLGVWSIKERAVLQHDFFSVGPRNTKYGTHTIQPMNWVHDQWLPFAKRVIDTVRKTHQTAILFLEPPVYVPPPNLIDEQTAAIIEGDEDFCAENHDGSTRRKVLPLRPRKESSGHSHNNTAWKSEGNRSSPTEATTNINTRLQRKKSKSHRHDHNLNTSLTTNMVFAPHHYDDLVLLTKKYLGWINIDLLGLSRGRHKSLFGSIVFGPKKAKALFGEQIHELQKECTERLGHRPVLIGETGLHFDVGLSEKHQAGHHTHRQATQSTSQTPSMPATTQAWKATRQFQNAFDNILNGLDKTMAHYTLWNYTIENDVRYGDGWNGENLSLFSKVSEDFNMLSSTATMAGVASDRLDLLDRGGRAVEQFCRPYPVATVGRPLKIEFQRCKKKVNGNGNGNSNINGGGTSVFKLWTIAPSILETTTIASDIRTEIYVPRIQFPGGPKGSRVQVSDGTWEWDTEQQLLWWTYGSSSSSLPSTARFASATSSSSSSIVMHEHWIEISAQKI